jgi:hypothetical protein
MSVWERVVYLQGFAALFLRNQTMHLLSTCSNSNLPERFESGWGQRAYRKCSSAARFTEGELKPEGLCSLHAPLGEKGEYSLKPT